MWFNMHSIPIGVLLWIHRNCHPNRLTCILIGLCNKFHLSIKGNPFFKFIIKNTFNSDSCTNIKTKSQTQTNRKYTKQRATSGCVSMHTKPYRHYIVLFYSALILFRDVNNDSFVWFLSPGLMFVAWLKMQIQIINILVSHWVSERVDTSTELRVQSERETNQMSERNELCAIVCGALRERIYR